MIESNEFFLIFLATVVIVRLFLFLKPVSGPTIKNFRIHHYMYGLVGIVIGLLTKSLLVYSIGIGLFVDELAFLLIRGKTHEDNYSVKSLLGTFFFVVLIFIFRNYFIYFF